MRIIAGTARRLPLKTVAGEDVRPTTDRIKETLFNMLRDEVPGSCFLDLFAGSGQIGLEAVSRGARLAVFVDSSRRAAECIEENIRFTKLGEFTKLYRADALTALRQMEGKYTFDVVFMDPPYEKGLEKEALSYLASSSLVRKDGLILVEALLGEDFRYLSDTGPDGAPWAGLVLEKIKTYKTNEHAFIRKE